MRIVYVGDVMGSAGLKTLEHFVDRLKKEYRPDCLVVQGENTTKGKGISQVDYQRLRSLGVDFITGGNWSPYLVESHHLLADPQIPLIGPANFTPESGPGWAKIEIAGQKWLFISLLGEVVGRQLSPIKNPLLVVDEILAKQGFASQQPPAAIVVNFHGDYSSQKKTIGYYLDGRVSLVVGDHWHVPTADSQILPKKTGHISDVGMTGSLDSSLGIDLEVAIARWRDQKVVANRLDDRRPWQLNAVFAKLKAGFCQEIATINWRLD